MISRCMSSSTWTNWKAPMLKFGSSCSRLCKSSRNRGGPSGPRIMLLPLKNFESPRQKTGRHPLRGSKYWNRKNVATAEIYVEDRRNRVSAVTLRTKKHCPRWIVSSHLVKYRVAPSKARPYLVLVWKRVTTDQYIECTSLTLNIFPYM